MQRQEAPSLLYTTSTSSPSSAKESQGRNLSASLGGASDTSPSTAREIPQTNSSRDSFALSLSTTTTGGRSVRSRLPRQEPLQTSSADTSSPSPTLKLGVTPLTKPLSPQTLGPDLVPFTLLVNLTFHRIEQHLFLAKAWATSAATAGAGARLLSTRGGSGGGAGRGAGVLGVAGSSSYLAAIGGAGAAILTPSVAVLNAFRKPQLPVRLREAGGGTWGLPRSPSRIFLLGSTQGGALLTLTVL